MSREGALTLREPGEYRSAITLKPHDVLEIPGVGNKVVGAITQIRSGRYRIRLDEQFIESVWIEVAVGRDEDRSPERLVGPGPAAEPAEH